MSFNDGKEFFNMVINTQSKIFETIKIEDNKFVQLYQKSPEKFIKVFRANKNIFEMEPSKAIRIVELQISL